MLTSGFTHMFENYHVSFAYDLKVEDDLNVLS